MTEIIVYSGQWEQGKRHHSVRLNGKRDAWVTEHEDGTCYVQMKLDYTMRHASVDSIENAFTWIATVECDIAAQFKQYQNRIGA